MNVLDYPFTVRRLSEEEGGGFVIEFPDLSGCISDGASIEEAIAHGYDAVACWIKAARELGRDIPSPSGELSGRWLQRVPKSLHARLASRAKNEGVSLNTLVIALISEAIGRRDVATKN